MIAKCSLDSIVKPVQKGAWLYRNFTFRPIVIWTLALKAKPCSRAIPDVKLAMAERRGLGTYMPNPSHIWQGFCSQLARWKTYTRAYTNNPDWPVIVWLREPLFKTTAAVACKYLASGTVLDIGTGPGRLPVLLAEMAPNVKCVGVDLEFILLHDAVKGASNRRCNDRVSFLMAAVQALPFVDQSFDMILSTMSLHQWRQRAEGVSRASRNCIAS